jgi:hypothetical protein
MAAYYVDASGFNQGAVAIVGEGATSGNPPTTAQLGIVNALAGTDVFHLASFQSPLQLTSYVSKVVTQ